MLAMTASLEIMTHPRSQIHYWKCDRMAAFHGTLGGSDQARVADLLRPVLEERFPGQPVVLRPAGGQGNHITFIASVDGIESFVRVEDGPERDDYMEVESRLLHEVRALGLPAPLVQAVDASRARVPFAWQQMEVIAHPDLNHHFKLGALDLPRVAETIGTAVARWQALQPEGFGPFDPQVLRKEGRLAGFHARYADYFHLHLDRHLRFLASSSFLSEAAADELRAEIQRHQSLLELEQGCLVHKDLALWNILGTPQHIAAYIDFDDAISGDPMDDLSLLGCFHEGRFLDHALAGYASVRPLPYEHRRRFWLHLLRNMIVKAVIRVGAGYFDRSDSFFLIGAGSSGQNLREFTLARLQTALLGLRENRDINTL